MPAPSSRRTATRTSGRPGSASGRPGASARPDSASGRPSTRTDPAERRKRGGGSNLPLYIIGALLAIGVTVLVSWNPVRRSMALNKLDSFKPGIAGVDAGSSTATVDTDPTALENAQIAANEFMVLVENDAHLILQRAINGDRGPFETQVYMARQMELAQALVNLAERRAITPRQRVLALTTLLEIFDPQKHDRLRFPFDLTNWAKGEKLPADAPDAARDLSVTAITLMARANRAGWLNEIASIPVQDGVTSERANAALAGIGIIASTGNADAVGHAIQLLSTPAAPRVLAHSALRAAIAAGTTYNHLTPLIALIGSPDIAVRSLAMDCMGSSRLIIPDNVSGNAIREAAGKNIAPKLVSSTPPEELAAALKATRQLKLWGARDAVLALIPELATLNLPGVTPDMIAATLGDACVPRSIPPDAPDVAANAKDAVQKYITALNDNAKRPIAATALGMMNGAGYAEISELRTALEILIKASEPECLAAVIRIVERTYNRAKDAAALGNDPVRWKAFLDKDQPRFNRYREIENWYATNADAAQQVKTGRAKLSGMKAWIEAARKDTEGWLAEKPFIPPLGLTEAKVRDLDRRLSMLHKDAGNAWAGAQAYP